VKRWRWQYLGLVAAHLTIASGALAAQAPIDSAADTLLAPVFREHGTVAITLETDLRELKGDRRGEPEWQPALVKFPDTGDTLEGEVRARGVFRRANCTLPPLRLDIPRKKAQSTPFAGLNKFKLVVHCENSETFEQYVVQEYLLYRIYNLLTPYSQRARLLRVTYVDTRNRRDSLTRYAILLEEDEDVAARTGSVLVEAMGAGPDDLDSYQSALFGVFQYLIGNTDWSITNLHNVKLLQTVRATYPMAYDFDFSGAVNARYASVDPSIPIRSVRERVFRGFCTPEDRWQEVYELFRSRHADIAALYESETALTESVRRRTLEYFGEFFELLNDPDRAHRALGGSCRKVPR
jgi:hypothetical protein